MVHAYREGASTYQLANQFNVRRNTVRDLLRREGLDVSVRAKRPALTDEQKAEARKQFAAGRSRRDLMEAYGVSESTIRRLLRA